ncbi:MAG: MBOAT family protein [Nitrospinae bacterium]|nr:MBOAT family protein [Nitrospinota bacterium]
MLFHRLDFFAFFLVVLALYACLGKRAQNTLLLVASYYFYAQWDYRFTLLLFGVTLVNFVFGHLIYINKGHAKLWLWSSALLSLGVLGYYKYYNFFIDNALAFFAMMGLPFSSQATAVILPVGVSFFTFQALSYPIDIYRGDTRPGSASHGDLTFSSAVGDFLDFALYVSFFPQLVAGPIERSRDLLKQILADRQVTRDQIETGLWLFCLGLAMKIGVADEIAPQVDAVYANVAAHSFWAIYAATVAFALQIYCDFAGYTFMARGVASLMGFTLTNNFLQPYLASSFQDFWRRWHISLSTWFRDYFYIPLGGNRHGPVRTYANLAATMVVVGLWHGATWAYVLWGVFHGALLAVERFAMGKIKILFPGLALTGFGALAASAAGRVVVLQGVLAGWFLFRVGDLSVVSRIVEEGKGWTWGGFADLPLSFPDALPYVSFLLIVALYETPCYRRGEEIHPARFSAPHRTALYLVLAMIIMSSVGMKDAPFIYFQF